MRTSNGCWTCKLRRKKCDERHPVCRACSTLNITCHNDQNKRPEWMDNGEKQHEMAEKVKREVKKKSHLRHREYPASTELVDPLPERSTRSHLLDFGICPISNLLEPPPTTRNQSIEILIEPQAPELTTNRDHDFSTPDSGRNVTLSQSDIVLFTFYLETLLPFLYPFYRPSHLQGGRSWILELMSRPVLRNAMLCQSSYFLSLTRGSAVGSDDIWDNVLKQTKDTFNVLGQALQIIEGSSVAEHLHGAVRIQTSITQVLRFEIAISSFSNWQPHLNAALALFVQLLKSTVETGNLGSNFNLIMGNLNLSGSRCSTRSLQDPSAEQAAFRFSSCLLIFDDIISSTVLQTKPRLYEYHANLLGSPSDDSEAPINVEAVLGINNTVLRQIGEISALAAWKEECRTLGTLDVTELVQHASVIKKALLTQLARLNLDQTSIPKKMSPLDAFAAPVFHKSPIGQIWIHAALIYLAIVISGWQPSIADVRNNVHQVITLLNTNIPPTLLPAIVWPFCVTGCLAEAAQESHFRGMVATLQPPSIFGTVHKALEVMERVWRIRGTDHSLASCFQLHGDIVLLI